VLHGLPLWVAAAWAMSLTTLGLFVVPMLFIYLPEKAMAGQMAAHLFTVQTGISTVCGMALLLLFRSKEPLAPADTAQAAILFVVAGVLLALLSEFAVTPHILARNNLALWHKVGSVMYLLQWVCAVAVFGKLVAAPRYA
jgi:Domain of unknown function (DUF4149)